MHTEVIGAAEVGHHILVQHHSPCFHKSDPPCGKPYHWSLEIFGCCCKVLQIVLAVVADEAVQTEHQDTFQDAPCPSFVQDRLFQRDHSSQSVVDEVVVKFASADLGPALEVKRRGPDWTAKMMQSLLMEEYLMVDGWLQDSGVRISFCASAARWAT